MPGGPWDTRHSLIPITDRNAAGIFMRAGRVGTKQTFEALPPTKGSRRWKASRMRESYLHKSFGWRKQVYIQDNSQFVFQMCLPYRLWFLGLGSSRETMGYLSSIACIYFDNLTALSLYFVRVLNFVNCKSMTSCPKQSAWRDKRDKENANMTQTTAVTS